MARILKVEIDQSTCVGNQWCSTALPAVFTLNDDGVAEVLDPSKATERELIETAGGCPVGAISVTDEETGEDLLEL